MLKKSLYEFVKQFNSQNIAAEKLCTSQGAISKALRKGREIYVIEENGVFSAFEVKPFPSQGKAA